MSILSQEWLVLPLFGFAVFIAVYMWAYKIFTMLYSKSVSKKSQVMLHMKLLNMDVDEKKVTRVLLLSSFGVGFLFFFIVWPDIPVGIFLGISSGIAGFQLVPIVYKSLYEKK